MKRNVIRRLSIEAAHAGIDAAMADITSDSERARDFLRLAHEKTGGATPELKRVYNSYLANERRRKTSKATLSVEQALEKHQRSLDRAFEASKQISEQRGQKLRT